MKKTLARFEKKLLALRCWFEEAKPYAYGIEHGFLVQGPLTEAALESLEQHVGTPFPLEYRAFLLHFGDGKVGPGWFQPVREAATQTSASRFPLPEPFLGCESPSYQALSEERRRDEFDRLGREWDAIPHDDGILRICDYGSSIYGHLILNGPFSGRVWMLAGDAAYYAPFGGGEGLHEEGAGMDWKPTPAPQDYSFFDWYEHWLDGQMKSAGLNG